STDQRGEHKGIRNAAIPHVVINDQHGERHQEEFKNYCGWTQHLDPGSVVFWWICRKVGAHLCSQKLHKARHPAWAVLADLFNEACQSIDLCRDVGSE